jgi:hypothetical protein
MNCLCSFVWGSRSASSPRDCCWPPRKSSPRRCNRESHRPTIQQDPAGSDHASIKQSAPVYFQQTQAWIVHMTVHRTCRLQGPSNPGITPVMSFGGGSFSGAQIETAELSGIFLFKIRTMERKCVPPTFAKHLSMYLHPRIHEAQIEPESTRRSVSLDQTLTASHTRSPPAAGASARGSPAQKAKESMKKPRTPQI